MTTHVVATAGHVDHGKSALVRALTGMEPDRHAEERRRGMTLDLGFAWTDVGEAQVAFVDVPGHERFVTTMLAGVGSVPAVLMVVAADGGWMPQSAEHLDALDALGVRHGVLAVTRSDLADPGPAIAEARERLAASGLGRLPSVAVSTVTGSGLDELRALLARLVAAVPTPRPDGRVRFWVDRSFTVRGAGTVVTGTLPSGTISSGDELDVGGRRVTVRGLESLGRSTTRVCGGARVALNLRGVAVDEVRRGAVLTTPGTWLAVDTLDGRLQGSCGSKVDPADLPRELMLHIGSAAVSVRVRPLGPDLLRLSLSSPLPLRLGDRLVLRDPGRRQVVGGVTVLDVRPPPLRRRGAARRRADELAPLGETVDVADELRRRRTVQASELVAMGAEASDVDAVPAVRGGDWLLEPSLLPELRATLLAAVAAHDAADPVATGLPTEAARRALDLPDARLLAVVADHCDELVVRDGRVRSVAETGLPEPLRRMLSALQADLRNNPFAAPEADRLRALGLGRREVAGLVRAGELLALPDGIVLLAGADDRAVDVLRALPDAFTLSEARQALGTTRRVAIPLLEHLARTRRSTRTTDGRHRLT